MGPTKIWVPAVIVLAVSVLLLPCLTGSRILAGFDHLAIWYPFMSYAQAGWQTTGMVPQWMSQIFGGMPFGASLVPSLYYPTDILCWIFGIPVHGFYALDTALHLALAGWGMIRLASAFGLSSPAGLIGGLAYAFSGYFMTQMNGGTTVFLRGASWLPWIFWAARQAAGGGSVRRWVTLGIFLSLLPLTACYQLFAYLILILPAFVWATSPPARRWRTLSGLAIVGVLAVTLAALNVLPAVRYFLSSMRVGSAADWSSILPFLPAEIPGLLVRDIFGHDPRTKYPGLIVLLLAILGATKNWRKAKLWLLLGVAGLLLALGPATPIGDVLAWFPIWKSFRMSSHWVIIFVLATAMLCAMGAERLFTQNLPAFRRSSQQLAAMGLSLAVLLGAASLGHRMIWDQIKSSTWVQRYLADAHLDEAAAGPAVGSSLTRAAVRSLAVTGAAVLVLLIPGTHGVRASIFTLGIVADLLLTGGPHPNTLDAAEFARNDPVKGLITRIMQTLPGPFRIYTEESHILVNMRIPAGLEWVKGYHGAPLDRFARWHDHAMACSNLPRVYSWLNVRYYLVQDPEKFPSLVPRSQFTSEDGRAYWICEHPDALPRAFFAARVEAADSNAAMLSSLCTVDPGLRQVLVPRSALPGVAGNHAGNGRIISLQRDPQHIEAEVEASSPGLVVFSEVFYPAWTAFVDGVRQRIIPVNVLLRGIAVGPGQHRITMVYDSIIFKLGLWITCASWAVVAFTLMRRCRNPEYRSR